MRLKRKNETNESATTHTGFLLSTQRAMQRAYSLCLQSDSFKREGEAEIGNEAYTLNFAFLLRRMIFSEFMEVLTFFIRNCLVLWGMGEPPAWAFTLGI